MPQPRTNSPWLAFDTETGNMFDPATVVPGGGGVFAKPPVNTPTQQDINAAGPRLPQFTPQSGGLPEHQNQELPFGFTPYTDKPEYQALLSQMAGNRSLAEAQQQQGISQYEDLLKAQSVRNQNQQVDLSPLASLVDSWTGSRLASGYKAPVSARSNLDATVALQQGLQKAKGALTDDQLAYLSQRAGLLQKGDETVAGLLTAANRNKELGLTAADSRARRADDKSIQYREHYNKEFGNSISQLGQFTAAVSDVKSLIQKNGGEIPQLGSANRALYDSAVATMITRYNADVAKLGALAGGDLNLLTKAVGNSPEALRGWVDQQTKGGGKGTLKVLSGLEHDADRTVENYGKRTKIWKGAVDDLYTSDKESYYKAKSGNFGQSAATDKPATINQGGHVYNLNPKTGEYE